MMFTVENLVAGYGEKTVLQDISFTLKSGLTVLLGQNGSGKTTLFRAICGSLKPSAGQVTLGAENLLSLSAKERAKRVAQVLGNHKTLSGITVEMLAQMALYPIHGALFLLGKSEKEQIEATAKELGMASLLNRLLETLSAGERQMAELLAAVCQNTPLLLLDEPTSSLDYNRTHEFMGKAKELAKKKILLATLHEPGLALRYADRILLLKEGRIAGDFYPRETSILEVEKYLRLLYPQIKVTQTENLLTVF